MTQSRRIGLFVLCLSWAAGCHYGPLPAPESEALRPPDSSYCCDPKTVATAVATAYWHAFNANPPVLKAAAVPSAQLGYDSKVLQVSADDLRNIVGGVVGFAKRGGQDGLWLCKYVSDRTYETNIGYMEALLDARSPAGANASQLATDDEHRVSLLVSFKQAELATETKCSKGKLGFGLRPDLADLIGGGADVAALRARYSFAVDVAPLPNWTVGMPAGVIGNRGVSSCFGEDRLRQTANCSLDTAFQGIRLSGVKTVTATLAGYARDELYRVNAGRKILVLRYAATSRTSGRVFKTSPIYSELEAKPLPSCYQLPSDCDETSMTTNAACGFYFMRCIYSMDVAVLFADGSFWQPSWVQRPLGKEATPADAPADLASTALRTFISDALPAMNPNPDDNSRFESVTVERQDLVKAGMTDYYTAELYHRQRLGSSVKPATDTAWNNWYWAWLQRQSIPDFVPTGTSLDLSEREMGKVVKWTTWGDDPSVYFRQYGTGFNQYGPNRAQNITTGNKLEPRKDIACGLLDDLMGLGAYQNFQNVTIKGIYGSLAWELGYAPLSPKSSADAQAKKTPPSNFAPVSSQIGDVPNPSLDQRMIRRSRPIDMGHRLLDQHDHQGRKWTTCS